MSEAGTVNVDTLVSKLERTLDWIDLQTGVKPDTRELRSALSDLAARARERDDALGAMGAADDASRVAELEAALIAVKHHPDTPEHIRRYVTNALAEDGGGAAAESLEARVILSERDETFDVKNIPAGDGGGA